MSEPPKFSLALLIKAVTCITCNGNCGLASRQYVPGYFGVDTRSVPIWKECLTCGGTGIQPTSDED